MTYNPSVSEHAADPSPEAMRRDIRKAIGQISTNNSGIIGYSSPLSSQFSSRLLDLIAEEAGKVADTFAEARVKAEREECAKVADEDAADGKRDLDDLELEGLAGARILAAERIAFHIRRRGEQP